MLLLHNDTTYFFIHLKNVLNAYHVLNTTLGTTVPAYEKLWSSRDQITGSQ